MKNKQKLLTSILVPVTALAVAGGAVGVVAAIKAKNTPDTPHFLNGKTITFSAGEGSFVDGKCTKTTFEAGTTFDRIDQPVVQSKNKNELFAGWADENGQIIHGNETVRKDMKLTALYKNASSSEYATVTFTTDPSEPGPVLQGNQRISVNKGYFFFMVNRPTAKWTVTESGVTKSKYFKGWRYSTGETVLENDVIRNDVTLYPIFNEAVTVTWHPHGKLETTQGVVGHGEIERGQTTTTLESNTAFGQFNQPALKFVYDATSPEGKKAYFAGWYKDEACENPWDATETLTADTDAYAKWADEPEIGDQYGTITFKDARSTDASGADLPSGMTFGWTPTDQIVIKLDDKSWGDTNKPTIVCYDKDKKVTTDYKVSFWEINDGTDASPKWVTLDDSYVFPIGKKTISIRPVLTYAIDSITVYGDNKVNLEETVQYNVQVVGGATSSARAVEWKLVLENDGTDTPFPDAIAEINNNGKVTVSSCSRKLFEQYGLDHFYVKAKSLLDSSKTSYLRVSIKMPYSDNLNVWVHTETSEPKNIKWYYASLSDFCDESTTTLTMKGMDDKTTKTFDKSNDFVDTITFGTDIGIIPDNFLAGWTNFKGNIDFANSNVVAIQDNFMINCTNFNGTLDLNNIIQIGSNFMKNCTSFNTPITWNSVSPLRQIGSDFMFGCTGFDSVITLPSAQTLWIDNNFMAKCTSFNQPLTLPNIIEYIGDGFMSECNDFTSTLTVNMKLENEKGGFVYSANSLSSQDSSANIGKVGFSVAGTSAEPFKKAWPSLTGPIHYRKVKESGWTGEVTAEEFAAAKTKLSTSFNFTAQMDEVGTLEVTDEGGSSNDTTTGYTKARLSWNYGRGEQENWLKPLDASKSRRVVARYEEDGEFDEMANSNDSYYGQIDGVHQMLSILPGKAAWTFDELEGWYTFETTMYETDVRITLRFDESGTHDINLFKLEINNGKEWVTEMSSVFSKIGTTTVNLPATLKTPTIATWDSTNSQYTAECTEGTTGREQFVMAIPLNATEMTTIPNALKIALDKTTTGIYWPDAWIFSKDGVEKDPITDGATEAITISTVQTVEEEPEPTTLEDGDWIILDYYGDSETGKIQAGTKFNTKADASNIVTINCDKPSDDTATLISHDGWETDWGTSLIAASGSAYEFKVRLFSGDWSLGTTIDTAKSTITIDGTAKSFDTAGITVAQDPEVTPTAQTNTYIVTVPTTALTGNAKINIAWAEQGKLNISLNTKAPSSSYQSNLYRDADFSLGVSGNSRFVIGSDGFAHLYVELYQPSATTVPGYIIDEDNSFISVDGGTTQISFADAKQTSAGYIEIVKLTPTGEKANKAVWYDIKFNASKFPSGAWVLIMWKAA